MKRLGKTLVLTAVALMLTAVGFGIEVGYALSTLRWALDGGTELDLDV